MSDKMKPEVKAKWTAALRSGDYDQTKGVMNNGKGGYCCLGVLCDLYAKETGKKWESIGKVGLAFEGEELYPSIDVQDWAGLPMKNPSVVVSPSGERRHLADLNDYAGKSFAEIADLIDAHL